MVMSRVASKSKERVLTKDRPNSPSAEEDNYCREVVLKKGPWTAAEDAILIEYVRKHGEGNWNALQKHSGLSRCGKSCRLRWANHLRPNLKKGAFTHEEERLVIELHASMGNKWARMAAHLPGRTDNEIKNFWNTRLKRLQRAGLPLYPPELTPKMTRESQRCIAICGNDGRDKASHCIFQNGFEIPEVKFDFKVNQGNSSYASDLNDINPSNILPRGLGSSEYDSCLLPTVPGQKRLRESINLLPVCSRSIKNEFPVFGQFQDGTHERVTESFGPSFLTESFGPSFQFDPDPNSKNPEPFDGNQGGHTLSNGNFSASKPGSEALKSELPSLQYADTVLDSWGTSCSPSSFLDSVDTFFQSPVIASESNYPSPPNSGLLDAVIQEGKTVSCRKHQSPAKSSCSSTCTPGDIGNSLAKNIFPAECDGIHDPLSPLDHTANSLLSEFTPVSANGSSLDEQPPFETFDGGYNVKPEPVDWDSDPSKEKESTPKLETTYPDSLLASGWIKPGSGHVKDHVVMTDAVAALLGEDLSSDIKQTNGGALSCTTNQGWGTLFLCME